MGMGRVLKNEYGTGLGFTRPVPVSAIIFKKKT